MIFDGFGAYSIDISVTYFVQTKDFSKFQATKQSINLGILKVLEKEKVVLKKCMHAQVKHRKHQLARKQRETNRHQQRLEHFKHQLKHAKSKKEKRLIKRRIAKEQAKIKVCKKAVKKEEHKVKKIKKESKQIKRLRKLEKKARKLGGVKKKHKHNGKASQYSNEESSNHGGCSFTKTKMRQEIANT